MENVNKSKRIYRNMSTYTAIFAKKEIYVVDF